MWRTARYDMVLWAHPPHDPSAILPGMMALLNHVSGQHLGWHLEGLPEQPLPTSRDEWIALTEKQRNARYGALDLFFESPGGWTMSLSMDAPLFVRDFDVFSFGLPEHLMGARAAFGFDSLCALFVESAKLFRPFWARVGDTELVIKDAAGQIYLSMDVTKVPATAHWLNYFDAEMAERLGGKEKLLRAPAYVVKATEDPAGILLILQREPFDYHSIRDRWRLWRLNRYLDLNRLHRLYPKRRESPPDGPSAGGSIAP